MTIQLTEADQKLIAEAAEAFRTDHRYLEQVLWAAQSRIAQVEKKTV